MRTTDAGREQGDALNAFGLRSGAVVAGRYRIERVIGEGSVGVVVAATHLVLEEQVALKLLRPSGLDAAGLARVKREARIAMRIRSEHVAAVTDIDAIDGSMRFIVMELLDGTDLGRLLEREGRLPVAEAALHVVQACAGVAELHAHDVIHRDLKPENLFLARRPRAEPIIKVLDFGMAKPLEATGANVSVTSESAFLGSPAYMSPEQITNPSSVDGRADVWSLGVILHELITGALPFDESSRAAMIQRISAGRPRRLREARSDTPAGLEALILDCLTGDLAARVPNVQTLAQRLAPFGDRRCERVVAGLAGRAPTLLAAVREHDALVAPARGGTLDEEATAAATTMGSVPARTRGASAAVPEDLALVGTLVGGRYRLRRLVGLGAMGAIYEGGEDGSHVGPTVALKVIRRSALMNPRAHRRLLNEARAALNISNDHVVKVLAVDVDGPDGSPFIVMELLLGTNLQEVLEEHGPLPADVVIRLFQQVSRGLEAVHANGHVHRDVKPSNIFLHRHDDGRITVKICDFGIVKSTAREALDPSERSLTRTGYLVGSPAYMSPEQIRSPDEIDARSDVWSLCASMYEALAGEGPWARSAAPVLVAICMDDPPPLRTLAPHVPPELEALVHRGLRRDRDSRIRTMRELGDALCAVAGGDLRLTEDMLTGVSGTTRDMEHAVPARPARRALGRSTIYLAIAGMTAAMIPIVLFVTRHRADGLGGTASVVPPVSASNVADAPSGQTAPSSVMREAPTMVTTGSASAALPSRVAPVRRPIAASARPRVLPASAMPPSEAPALPAPTAPAFKTDW